MYYTKENFNFFCKFLGLTQKELAQKLGISEFHLSKMRNGIDPVSNKMIEKITKLVWDDLKERKEHEDFALKTIIDMYFLLTPKREAISMQYLDKIFHRLTVDEICYFRQKINIYLNKIKNGSFAQERDAIQRDPEEYFFSEITTYRKKGRRKKKDV